MAQNGSLTPKQKRVLSALMTSKTVTEAAETARVGRRTLTRWLNEDDLFRAEYHHHLAEAVRETTRRAVQGASKAVDALIEVLDTGKPADKVRAAAVLLDRMPRLRELENLEDRLVRLEMAYNAGDLRAYNAGDLP